MSNEITPFEAIRRTNTAGNEFWSSRDFAKILGYADDRNFQSVIESARTACFNSGQRVEDHFVDVTDMIAVGKGANLSSLPYRPAPSPHGFAIRSVVSCIPLPAYSPCQRLLWPNWFPASHMCPSPSAPTSSPSSNRMAGCNGECRMTNDEKLKP